MKHVHKYTQEKGEGRKNDTAAAILFATSLMTWFQQGCNFWIYVSL